MPEIIGSYLDESGDHSLARIDSQYPVFVLGGVVIDADYADSGDSRGRLVAERRGRGFDAALQLAWAALEVISRHIQWALANNGSSPKSTVQKVRIASSDKPLTRCGLDPRPETEAFRPTLTVAFHNGGAITYVKCHPCASIVTLGRARHTP